MLQVASDDKLGAAGTDVILQGGGLRATEHLHQRARLPPGQTVGGAFQVDAGKTLTLTGSLVGGPGNFTKVDRGTLVLAGTNTYGGNIYNNGGTLQGNTSSLRGNIVFDTNASNTIARSVTFDQATDGTFAGNITGIGSVTKTGAGTLTLGGDQHLQHRHHRLGRHPAGHDAAACRAPSLNNAAVIFDQAFDGTYAGNMTGTGTLTKNGTGKLNLTGTSSVGGGTTINAGGFAVNGSLTSNVTVNKGGTLSGAGNINGNITNNGGTIEPGNSIGHLTINGNFTHQRRQPWGSRSIANGDSDRISVIGAGHKVTINAGTLEIVAGGRHLRAQHDLHDHHDRRAAAPSTSAT